MCGASRRLARDALTVLVRLLDAIIDRLADELEVSAREIETISHHIFNSRSIDERRIPAAADRAADPDRPGADACSRRSATPRSAPPIAHLPRRRRPDRRSATNRARPCRQPDDRRHSLSSTASFLSDNLTFLLDAALGLISIEQNAAMKLFSWAALIFLPPTLIAGIYGMNFEHMPELDWLFGYPLRSA